MNDLAPTSPVASFRIVGLPILAALVQIAGLATILFAQQEPYSRTPEFRKMISELKSGDIRPSRLGSGELLNNPFPRVAVTVRETEEELSLGTQEWRLRIKKAPWQFDLTNRKSSAVWQIQTGDSRTSGIWWLQQAANQPAKTVRLTRIQQIEREENRWIVRGTLEGIAEPARIEIALLSPEVIKLSIEPPETIRNMALGFSVTGTGPYFGLGERFLKAKLDGSSFTLRPEDSPGYPPFPPGHYWTYIPVPFLFTPRGLGLYLDTAWVSHFDLSQPEKQRFSVEITGPHVDCYFFIGEPKTILGAYTDLTGRPPLPPPWTFGVWIDCRQGKDSVLETAKRLRQEGIPVSAIWLHTLLDSVSNIGYPFYPTAYSGEPRQFVDAIQALGFKVLGYRGSYVRSVLIPYLLPNPTYEEGTKNHYFVTEPDGEPSGPTFEPVRTGNIDFTNPGAVDWWEGMLKTSLVVHNLDGWMEDFGEWVADDDRFSIGLDGREMSNLYPLLYHMLTYRIARRYKQDFVGFARSGYSGSQASTAAVWGGDQSEDWSLDNGLPSVVTAGITAGLMGFSTWGPDIVSWSSSKELWIRWLQFGALTPVMRDHLGSTPKFSVDLWFDKETLDTFRRYAKLHVSLFPYLYTYAHEASNKGLPIMRHLMLEWPEDPKTWEAEHQYLLGQRLMVAPVVAEGARSRSLYLPKGAWTNFWTGEILEGGRQVEVDAPLGQIPLLVRAGSVIPLIDPRIETLARDLAGAHKEVDSALIWRVFPASSTTTDRFTLYDGTRVVAEQGPGIIQVKCETSPRLRDYEVIVAASSEPSLIELSGQALTRLNEADYRARKKGWYLNRGERTLHVVFSSEDFVVKISE